MNRRLAFGFLALLAFALFARPLLRGEVLTFRDHSDYFQPLRYFTAVELRHLRLPLWNPYNASGEPWLANPQTGVFYPPAWLFLVLPFATAYVLFLWLHVALLGCGAFLLFSRIGSPRAAFLGSVILILCGPVLSMVDVSNNLATFAWIPLVLWCALATASPSASGAAIAMSFLAGEPFFAAAGAVMFAMVRRADSQSAMGEPAKSRLYLLFDTAITAFFLSGIQLLPFLAMVIGSDRAGSVPREEVLRNSMPLGDWTRLLLPIGGMQQQFIPSLYIGFVAALLAVIGVAACLRRRAAHLAIALVAVCVMVAAGSYLPWSGRLLSALPLTVIRYPARLVPLAALGLVVLAVIGWDRAERVLPFRWLFVAAVALVITDLVPRVPPLLASAPFNAQPVPYAHDLGRDGKILRLLGDRFQKPSFDRRAWISGYLNLFGRRFDAWTAAPVVSQRYTDAYRSALARPDRLDALSIEYVLANRRIAALPVVARAGEVLVHRNAAALPLAYWRDGAGHVLRAGALAFTTSAMHVVVDAPRDGVVIVTQQNANGWEVEIDGAPARAEADGMFCAVRVRGGHHAITWRYRPRAFFIGSALTMLAIARMLLSSKFVKRKWHESFFVAQKNFA